MDIQLILIPILVAVISSYLTYYFAIKSRKDESISEFREEKYTALLVYLQGFVGKTASGEIKRKFFEEQYKSWLYASDGVVKAVNNMVQLVIDSKGNDPNAEVGRKAVGNIVLEMRKDLLGKTDLKSDDFRYIDVID